MMYGGVVFIMIQHHFCAIEMLAPAFTKMSTIQWGMMPSDTNGVESLNKCSIDHTNRSKTLQGCLEFTYRLDKKTTLEHIFSYSALPLSFQRKTIESCKNRGARQKKTRYKRGKSAALEDDVGLKGTRSSWNTCVRIPYDTYIVIVILWYIQVLPQVFQKVGRGGKSTKNLILTVTWKLHVVRRTVRNPRDNRKNTLQKRESNMEVHWK